MKGLKEEIVRERVGEGVRERVNEKWEWRKGNLKGGLMVEKRIKG